MTTPLKRMLTGTGQPGTRPQLTPGGKGARTMSQSGMTVDQGAAPLAEVSRIDDEEERRPELRLELAPPARCGALHGRQHGHHGIGNERLASVVRRMIPTFAIPLAT